MKENLRHPVLTILFAFALNAFCVADSLSLEVFDEVNDWLDDEYQKNLDQHLDNPRMLVRRGLLADSRHRYIDLLASATGAGPETLIDTFIAADSDDPQRTLAVTPVRPDDFQVALEFIGMTPGHPIDLSRTLLWPKGERVTITYFWIDEDEQRFSQSARAEELIKDVSWNEHLPKLGFRFVGPASESGPAANESLIATSFNSQNTILEVAYVADRRALSGQLVANDKYRLAAGQKLRIRIRPEFRADETRVYDYLADIEPGDGVDAQKLPNLSVRLKTHDGEEVISGDFKRIFAFLEVLINDGKEPFIQLRFSDALAAQSVKNVARFAQKFLIEQDIRIEPSDAHLFYGAFLPQASWLNSSRRGRSSQPLEIHWGAQSSAEGFTGKIIQQPLSPESATKQQRFSDVESFKEAIRRGQPWQTDAVFLLVNPNLPYGEIRKVFELIRTQFPNVYVFM